MRLFALEDPLRSGGCAALEMAAPLPVKLSCAVLTCRSQVARYLAEVVELVRRKL